MTAENPLAADRDAYRKTATELSDLIRDLEVFAEKFKSLSVIIEDDKADRDRIHSDAQLLYRDLGTLLELAARLARR